MGDLDVVFGLLVLPLVTVVSFAAGFFWGANWSIRTIYLIALAGAGGLVLLWYLDVLASLLSWSLNDLIFMGIGFLPLGLLGLSLGSFASPDSLRR